MKQILISLLIALHTFTVVAQTSNISTKGGTYQLVETIDESLMDGNSVVLCVSHTHISATEQKVMVMGTHTLSYDGTKDTFYGYNTGLDYDGKMPKQIVVPSVNAEGMPYEYTLKKNSTYFFINNLEGKYVSCNSGSLKLVDRNIGNENQWKLSSEQLIYTNGKNSYYLTCEDYPSPGTGYGKNGYFFGTKSTTNFNRIYLYKKISDDITDNTDDTSNAILEINQYHYATLYYRNKDVEVPRESKALIYSLDENNQLYISYWFYAGDIIPHNTPVVIFNPFSGYYHLRLLEPTLPPVNVNNALYGFDKDTMTDNGDGQYFILSYGSQGLAFYWPNEVGGPFITKGHKAYLFIPSSSVSNSKSSSFTLPKDEQITGLNLLSDQELSPVSGIIYDSSGRVLGKSNNGSRIQIGGNLWKKISMNPIQY